MTRRALRRLWSSWWWPAADRGARRVVCHEWFVNVGGSDKVALELADVVGADVVYAFAVDPRTIARLGADRPDGATPVVTWRFGHRAARVRRFELLLPLMPVVWRALDLGGTELVVTSSHACVNAVRAPRVVSYCHTPMRYAWDWRLESGRAAPWIRPALPALAALFRFLDRRWSRHVGRYLANSTFVAARIRQAYAVEAVVVPPPVDTGRFTSLERPAGTGPFVAAGRFVPYKRFDLAIEAANRAGVDLVVAGDGPDLERLRRLAGPTVCVEVAPDDRRLDELLVGARAFVFPGIEDFGMLPVEAQAAGTPVIARRAGGALDSVSDGVTGVFVDGDDVGTWAATLAAFDPSAFDERAIRLHADGFGEARFRERLAALGLTGSAEEASG